MLCKKTAVLWLGVFLFFLLTSGCQNPETFYRGDKAEGDSASPLVAGDNQQGTWKTFDIELNYNYDLEGDALKIAGSIDFGLFYELNASRIKALDVYLFFLDNQNKVIETVSISQLPPASAEETIGFAKNLNIPAGAEAIAFGYSGEAYQDGNGSSGPDAGGSGGGGLLDFSDLPKKVKR